MDGPPLGTAHPGVHEHPGPGLKLRRFGIDAPEKAIVGAIERHDDIFQMYALVGDAQCMNHGLLRRIALSQP